MTALLGIRERRTGTGLVQPWTRVGTGAQDFALIRLGGRLHLAGSWRVPNGWAAAVPVAPVFGLPGSWGDCDVWQHRDGPVAFGIGLSRKAAVEALFSAAESGELVAGSLRAWRQHREREAIVRQCSRRLSCGPTTRDKLERAILEAL